MGHRAHHDQQPDHQLRSEPAVGPPGRVFAAAPARIARSMRRGTSTSSRSETRRAPSSVPRGGRADGRGGQAGVLDVQGGARPTSTSSSDRWSWRRSSRAQNRIRVDAGQIAAARSRAGGGRSGAAAREPDHARTTAAEDAEDRLRRLIMDPADASFWRVRLDPVEEPTAPGALPDVDAAVAKALERALRPRARRPRAGERAHRRGVPRQPAAARRAARDVVSRQRARRHAVPARRRISRHR